MRRALAAAAGTVAGLAAVLSYKSGPVPRRVALASPTPGAGDTTTTATEPPTTTTEPPTTTTEPPTTTTPPTTVPRTTTTTRTRPRPTTTTAPPDVARSYDGAVETNRFGDVQVRAVLRGNRLVDVVALQLPNDRARSAYISEQAAPVLRQEALDAQSASIDTVSGATYTSESYAQSLQAALDAAHRP